MMHGHGKSDSSIVLAKPPNEAGPEAKEAVEGRGLAKGKTPERNMSRTQGRSSMSSALERIRQAASSERSERCYHSHSLIALALLPKARAGCGNSARPDPCGGPPARAVPTATSSRLPLPAFNHNLIDYFLVIPTGEDFGNFLFFKAVEAAQEPALQLRNSPVAYLHAILYHPIFFGLLT